MIKCRRLMQVLVVLGLLAGFSCRKPFDGLEAILSNSYIAHTVAVQIADANPNAANPYPANAVITLSGEAVAAGMIYTNSGEQLDGTPGSVKPLSGFVSLAVKPYMRISPEAPVRFTISVRADGYLTATKHVIVTAADSLQLVDIPMIHLASPPAGVAVAQGILPGVDIGLVPAATTVEVGASAEPAIKISFPSGTELRDAGGMKIPASGTLEIQAAHFDNSSPAVLDAIPGGLSNVMTTGGEEITFMAGSAVELTMMLGHDEVKSFSKAVQMELPVNPQTFNPKTGTQVKAGDVLEVWSTGTGSSTWKKEGESTLFMDNGVLKGRMNVSHLSTYVLVCGSYAVCAAPLNLTIESDVEGKSWHLITVNDNRGYRLASKTVAVANGEVVQLKLPAGLDYNVLLHETLNSSSAAVDAAAVPACATSARLYYNRGNGTRLFFDLATQCQNGTFRYTGPISYKLPAEKRWRPFTPAVNGTLTTALLEWGKTYDFRIVFKGKEWVRRRTVNQAEFRQENGGNVWSFWGTDAAKRQKFFSAPTVCN